MKQIILVWLGFILVAFGASISQAQSDFRPPAYPLITVDPYFSIWSFQDELYNGPTYHWTEKPHSLQGIIRVDGESMYFLGQPIPQYETILPLTKNQKSWKYTFTQPQADWNQPNYNPNSWKTATGAFSDTDRTPNLWTTDDIWVRRTFEIDNLDEINLENLLLNLYHDDNVEVYINGELAYKTEGWVGAPERFLISDKAKQALKEGRNVLAIHCENTAGGAYLDAGLVEKQQPAISLGTVTQTEVEVTATQTRYWFEAGPVELVVTFTAPLLPKKLHVLSRPANYITFEVHSTDGESHDVQLYLSAAANIAVNTVDQPVVWQSMPSDELNIMRVGTAAQQVLGRKGDNVRIDWGYLYLSAPKEKNITTAIASSQISVQHFAEQGRLTFPDDEQMSRPAQEATITLAAAYDFGSVEVSPEKRHAVLAYDDLFSVEYFQRPLQAWWKKDGLSVVNMLEQVEADYESLMEACVAFDQQLYEEAKAAGGEKYAQLTELAFRQSVAAHKLVQGPQGKSLFFSKENFSNGSIGTVDITYPSSPLFLYYNPELLKGMMRPIFYYTESGQWTKPFPAHDVGLMAKPTPKICPLRKPVIC